MKLKNRIAAEDLIDVQAWTLPSMDGKGNVLPAEAKPNRDPKLGNTAAPKPVAVTPEPVEEVVAEVVEDVDALDYTPMTADELQALTDAAEQEGLAQGRKRGLEQGLEEGRQKGYDAGLLEAQQEAAEQLQQQVTQLLQIAEQLVEPIAVQQQGLEHLLVETISALTKQLVTRELQTDSSDILSVVQRAMIALPVGGQQVTLRLNPDDLALVEAHSEEQHLAWRFIGDASLVPGGCKISTVESLVDFSVETRLEMLLQQFASGQLHDEGVAIPEPEPEPEPDEGEFNEVALSSGTDESSDETTDVAPGSESITEPEEVAETATLTDGPEGAVSGGDSLGALETEVDSTLIDSPKGAPIVSDPSEVTGALAQGSTPHE